MPSVLEKGASIAPASIIVATVTLPGVVTENEISALEKAITEASNLNRQAEKAKELQKQLMLAFAQKTLGITTEDELKALDPVALSKRLQERYAKKAFTIQGGLDFAFNKTSQGRYPSYKDLFTAAVGEAAAVKALNETPTTYSYKVASVPRGTPKAKAKKAA
jgi:hypothetical protein